MSERGSLKAKFRAAERQRAAIEGGLVRFDAADPSVFGDAVRAAVDAYAQCERLAAQLALFSDNEAAEDIATAHLPFLLVSFYAAELALRIPSSFGTERVRERRATLKTARELYERFLHRLDGYGLLASGYARMLAAYAEDPTRFSSVGSLAGSSTASGNNAAKPKDGLAGLVDPAARRNAKIANFQAEKELRGKLEALRQQQQQRREALKRRRQRMRVDDEDNKNDDENNSGDDDDDDEDDDDDDDDDEAVRALYVAQLAHAAHMAFQGLDGINVEDEMLAHAPEVPTRGPTYGGLGDGRQRVGPAEDVSDRLDQMSLSGGHGASRLQSALAAGAPTWAGTRGGPLLSKDGRPKQPFTITSSRAELAKGVFRPGHNLPTMSIDDYLEEERRRGNFIEGGGEASGRAPTPDEDDYDKADAETLKARAWDEFVEANPKGAGNTINRG